MYICAFLWAFFEKTYEEPKNSFVKALKNALSKTSKNAHTSDSFPAPFLLQTAFFATYVSWILRNYSLKT